MIGNSMVVTTPTARQVESPPWTFRDSLMRPQGFAPTTPSRARRCEDCIAVDRIAGQCPDRART